MEDRVTERLSITCYASQMSTAAEARPGWWQDAGTASRPLPWVAGNSGSLDDHLLPHNTLAGKWVGRRGRTWFQALWLGMPALPMVAITMLVLSNFSTTIFISSTSASLIVLAFKIYLQSLAISHFCHLFDHFSLLFMMSDLNYFKSLQSGHCALPYSYDPQQRVFFQVCQITSFPSVKSKLFLVSLRDKTFFLMAHKAAHELASWLPLWLYPLLFNLSCS